ncbi:uncharacterized protein [Narcine bancroftii]|uniref:uncharacterized protein isoform X2 n=1 Tax=Narcine bancroftii TaxID=1343680 RepID=UPI003831834B
MSLNSRISLSGLLLSLLSFRLVADAQVLESYQNTNLGKKETLDKTNSFNADEYEEIGPCSVTCGGKPVYISDDVVELQCIFTNPSKKYDFIWKVIAADQEPIILKEDQPTIHVEKEDQPVAYQCDTLLEDDVVASIKYSVYTNTDGLTRTENPALGVKSQIVLMGIAGGTVMVVLSITCGIIYFCRRRKSKQQGKKKTPPPRPPLPPQYNARKGPRRIPRCSPKIPEVQRPRHIQPPPRPPPPSPSQPASPRRPPVRPRGPPPPRPSAPPQSYQGPHSAAIPRLRGSPPLHPKPGRTMQRDASSPIKSTTTEDDTSYTEEPTYGDFAIAPDSSEILKHLPD